MIKFTIVTINYNNYEGLRKTCESVAEQTFQNFEWIIIDGGSKDGSKEYVEQFRRKPDYFVSEKDAGVYDAMNKGIAATHGEYLLFLNSGDFLVDGNVLQHVIDNWQEADIVYGDAFFCRGSEEHEEHYPEYFSLYDYWRIYTMCHQATFIRASLLQERGYDTNYRIVADFKRWIEWKLEGRSFCHIPVTICRYQLDGISSTNLELHHQEHDQVMKELLSPVMYEQMEYIDQLKGHYEEVLRNRDQELARRDQELARRDQEIANLHTEIGDRDNTVLSLHNELSFWKGKNLKHLKEVRLLSYICIGETAILLSALLIYLTT